MDFLHLQPEKTLEEEFGTDDSFTLTAGPAPVIVDPFDPAPLLALFQKYHAEIDKMANAVMGLEVMDDLSLELATTYTTQAKALSQTIEKKRVEKKKPYMNVTDVLDGETKGLKDRLAAIQKHANEKIRPYLQKKEAERRKSEEAARKEAEALQKKLDEEAKKTGEEAPVVVAETGPAETKIETTTGTAKIKESWTFEIQDIKALPDAAFEARAKEVKAALSPWVRAQVAAGTRKIPGVKIFKEAKIDTRTKRGGMQF